MFIFIDVTTLQKELKRKTGYYKTDNGQTEWILIRTSRCLRIFFIPVWHWGEKYYRVDANHGTRYEISEADAILVQYNKKDMEDCKTIAEDEEPLHCSYCGYVADKDYRFCPYCGQKMK